MEVLGKVYPGAYTQYEPASQDHSGKDCQCAGYPGVQWAVLGDREQCPEGVTTDPAPQYPEFKGAGKELVVCSEPENSAEESYPEEKGDPYAECLILNEEGMSLCIDGEYPHQKDACIDGGGCGLPPGEGWLAFGEPVLDDEWKEFCGVELPPPGKGYPE